uniref:C2H2-type domain-containing protein n=2 Tax=Kalanchoe fedtschenkoi TaxID=63787 RepID=A0A7N0TG09_KALFE
MLQFPTTILLDSICRIISSRIHHMAELRNMAASHSSSLSFFGASQDDHQQMMSNQQILQQQNSSAPPQQAATTPQKKRRNLPGNPNPDAEVIALSPKTLMATNRFICEVCNKGFQREQNLQLHRRGHNLPWKLKQKSTKEVKRKVYLCPEPTCVHHDPSRALGDLTGIKKHFSRKHGEKKWKCDKCSKRYAVQSDWKAHSKTCGTREYRCDCGTLFSRRDSFITHRAFCDALAQESSRHPSGLSTIGSHLYGTPDQMNLSLNSQLPSAASMLQPGTNTTRTPKFEHMNHISSYGGQQYPPQTVSSSGFFINDNPSSQGFHQDQSQHGISANKQPLFHGLMQISDHGQGNNSPTALSNMFNLGYYAGNNATATNNNGFSSAANINMAMPESLMRSEDHQVNNVALGPSNFSSMYNTSTNSLQQADNMGLAPHMSATALLQKAAQMGSTTSANNSSLLRGFASSTKSSDRSHPVGTTTTNLVSGNSARGVGENLQSSSSIMDSGNNHLQSLMNSLANESSSVFKDGVHGQSGSFMSRMLTGSNNSGDHVHHQKNNMASNNNFGKGIMSSENEHKLTLDFLGVGGMVRSSMSGGFSQRSGEMHQSVVEFNPLGDTDQLKPPAPANLSYAGGKLH